jgi:DNA-binding transcriptional MerR regulator
MPEQEAPPWRIDDLAQRARVSVDTIRYYAREGLLLPPTRAGRHRIYGPDHLERLRQIRELQEQRFSLAAIRAIVCADRPGIDGIFGGAANQYTEADLVERSGLPAGFVADLRAVGLMPEPAEFGRDAYDDADLRMLRSVRELLEIGMPASILTELGAVYVTHFRALQTDVHAVLAGWTRDDWNRDELHEVQKRLTVNSERLIPAVDRVLNYVHQRTVQRLTLEAIRTAAATNTGVGGVRRDKVAPQSEGERATGSVNGRVPS